MGMIACFQMVDNQCISQLLEKDEDELFEIIEEMQEDDDSVLDLDKLWDGLHFLLTGAEACDSIDRNMFGESTEENLLSESIIGTVIFEKEINVEYPVLHGVASKDGGFQLVNYNSLLFFDPVKLELRADGMTFDSAGFQNEVVGYDGRCYVKKADGIYVGDEPYVMYSDTDCNVYKFMLSDFQNTKSI